MTKDIDYLEFSLCFGDNQKLYNLLKPIKDSGKLSWKEIRNIKYSDIDLENQTIKFKQK